MNKKKANQTPDKKVTKKRLDHSEEDFDMWRKGEMDKEELSEKVGALMGNIDSEEPPSEDIEDFMAELSANKAAPPEEKSVAKAILAKPNTLKTTPKKTAPKPNATANTTPSKTPKVTTPRSAAKVSKNTDTPNLKKTTTKPKASASTKSRPAKNNVPLASGAPTSKLRTAPKKTVTPPKKAAKALPKTTSATKKIATAPKKVATPLKKTTSATKKTLAKSSKRAKVATLQDKKVAPRTKKVIVRQPFAQHTAQNTSLALAKDNIGSSSNESKAVGPFYRRRSLQIGLVGLLCAFILYAVLAPQPISKDIPIYEESVTGYYYREFVTVKTPLDVYINRFDQKAWAVIQLQREGKDTTSAVKERQQAYQNLVEALKKLDPTGEVMRELKERQAAIAKTLKK